MSQEDLLSALQEYELSTQLEFFVNLGQHLASTNMVKLVNFMCANAINEVYYVPDGLATSTHKDLVIAYGLFFQAMKRRSEVDKYCNEQELETKKPITRGTWDPKTILED